jgi:hypothetical protein
VDGQPVGNSYGRIRQGKNGMPTLLQTEGFRFFFYSNERLEPPHVHVEKGDGEAKIWLDPVQVAYSHRLTPAELRRARELVFQHQAMFKERWNEHFRR